MQVVVSDIEAAHAQLRDAGVGVRVSAFPEPVEGRHPRDDVDWTVQGTHPLAGRYHGKAQFVEGRDPSSIYRVPNEPGPRRGLGPGSCERARHARSVKAGGRWSSHVSSV
jgi:hypothetical protein